MNDNVNIIFGSCLGIILIILLAWAFIGWVFMLLWNWIIPLFWTTAPILTYCESCGVIAFVLFILSIFRNNNKN